MFVDESFWMKVFLDESVPYRGCHDVLRQNIVTGWDIFRDGGPGRVVE